MVSSGVFSCAASPEITTISTDILTNITTSIQTRNVLSSTIVNGSNIEENIITTFIWASNGRNRGLQRDLVNDTSGGTVSDFIDNHTKTDIATDQILMSIVVLKDASEFTSQR
jgi:hypothetical protein